MHRYSDEELVIILEGGAPAMFKPNNIDAIGALFYVTKEVLKRCGEEELTIEAFAEEPNDIDDLSTLMLIKRLLLICGTTEEMDGLDVVAKVMIGQELLSRMKAHVQSEV